MRRRIRIVLTLAMLLAVIGTVIVVWAQRARDMDIAISMPSPSGRWTASGATVHRMRVFGGDQLSYRFSIAGTDGKLLLSKEVPVPTKQLGIDPDIEAEPISNFLFQQHGRMQWDTDGRTVRFLVRDTEVFSCSTTDGT